MLGDVDRPASRRQGIEAGEQGNRLAVGDPVGLESGELRGHGLKWHLKSQQAGVTSSSLRFAVQRQGTLTSECHQSEGDLIRGFSHGPVPLQRMVTWLGGALGLVSIGVRPE